ncbi:hypothetical protein AB0953_20270 [Streptomyces sp. NPDC046866]|uniref:hypothetical protein n=1 Tax=Streptomyces sp. NPDC046866 TaxID=3154921 RepID=UPI0034562DF2
MTASTAATAGPLAAPGLVVGRLSATLRHGPGRPPPAADPLRGPLLHAVGGRLESALRALALPPGRWCVARLDLTLPLDLDRPERALADDWSRAVAAAIERTVREGAAGGGPAAAVHYRHDADLLADAVAGLATGRLERLWAWRQTGLLHPGDPAPQTSPGEAALAVLARHPQQAAAAVLRAAEQCGAAALHRAWGRHGWQRLAALAGGAGPASGSAAPGSAGTEPRAADSRARAHALLAGSRLAALLRDSRLRPAEETAAAWAVLILAETDPAALHRPGLHRLLTEALSAPDPSEPALPPPGPQGPAGRRREAAGAPGAVAPGPRAAADEDGPAAPARQPSAHAPRRPAAAPSGPAPDPGPALVPVPVPVPDPPDGAPTDWAGLLFLLATAADAGLPDRALDEPALGARPLPWVLHATARTLLPAADPDDPALLALAGTAPARAAPLLAAAPPTPRERPCLDALAAAWARATAARMAEPADPHRLVAAVARRRGRILAEPGWIEVVLPGADADVAVRRAGLDLDPGWVGWLGAVVRFRYV